MIQYSIKIACLFLSLLAPIGVTVAAGVGVRVMTLDHLPNDVQLKINDELADVDFPYLSIGHRFLLESGSNLEFFQELPDPNDPDGGVRIVNVGTVEIPNGAGLYLIILKFNPTAELVSERVQGRVYREDSETFPPGSVQVVNLSHETIATKISGKEAVIKPYGVHLFHPKLQRYRYRIQAVVEDDGSWDILHSGVASMQTGARVYCFALYDRFGMRHLYSEMELKSKGDPDPTFFWLRLDDIPPPLD